MPRNCTICAHPEREAIDAAIVSGVPLAALAAKYRVSADALGRHAAHHLPAAMVKGRAAADMVHGDDLLAQARDLQAKALGILAKAEKAGDLRTAVAANREARGCLELLARLLAELPEGVTVNLAVSSEWLRTREVVLLALLPFPEAREAVSARLAALEVPGAGD